MPDTSRSPCFDQQAYNHAVVVCSSLSLHPSLVQISGTLEETAEGAASQFTGRLLRNIRAIRSRMLRWEWNVAGTASNALQMLGVKPNGKQDVQADISGFYRGEYENRLSSGL
jgi:hypothetical protein